MDSLTDPDRFNDWNFPRHPEQNIYPPNGENYPSAGPQANSTYEYVIVGSGAGGSPLAARLALAGYSVLLIDAGEDHGTDRQLQVPALHPYASEYNPSRWDFFVDHYANETQAIRDTKMAYITPSGDYYVGTNPPEGSVRKGVLYPRTGALGGSTQHNALVTVKPTRNDWNNIAAITGDKSWEADKMQGYFEKMEA